MVADLTGFWLLRHAIVSENARAILYGAMDVEVCPTSLVEHRPMYEALARRLPRPAKWIVTPLSRTRRTALEIFAHGYDEAPLAVEPAFAEQHLGEWQGLPHHALPARLTLPPHPFWPHAGLEQPPGGESMLDVIERVGGALDTSGPSAPGKAGRGRRAWRRHSCGGRSCAPHRPRQRAPSQHPQPILDTTRMDAGRMASSVRERTSWLLTRRSGASLP